MKIFRVAQSGGGDGTTTLVMIIDKKTGSMKLEIVGHEGGKTCANSSAEDEALLNDLMNSEVDGIGSLGEKTEEGPSALAMKELLTKTPATPVTTAPAKTPPAKEKKQKQLDVGGYGI